MRIGSNWEERACQTWGKGGDERACAREIRKEWRGVDSPVQLWDSMHGAASHQANQALPASAEAVALPPSPVPWDSPRGWRPGATGAGGAWLMVMPKLKSMSEVPRFMLRTAVVISSVSDSMGPARAAWRERRVVSRPSEGRRRREGQGRGKLTRCDAEEDDHFDDENGERHGQAGARGVGDDGDRSRRPDARGPRSIALLPLRRSLPQGLVAPVALPRRAELAGRESSVVLHHRQWWLSRRTMRCLLSLSVWCADRPRARLIF